MVKNSEKSFDDFYLSDEMLKALDTIGYKKPTPVQVESIPLILAGIDLIVQSQTGSGKTAAFAIPTTEMLEPHPGRVEVLVLAPTRELAKQVCQEFENLSQYKELSATAIYGGASYEKQFEALETAQIVSATPGRLLDLAKRGAIDLSNLRILCLDEADEMLSMGFREELNAIVDFLPEERQSLLFSATVNEEIKALAKGILYYPEYISLSGDQVAAEKVEHIYYRIRGVGRKRDLLRVLEYENPESALIFCNTRNDTFTVTEFLKRHDYRAEVLNGDLPQKQREATLGALREGKVDFIVATDVAARGIDITDLSHVFNYTLPSSAEIYIHRTGRTGRAGKSGRAVSLVSPAEMATHFDIVRMYDIDIDSRELPEAEKIIEAKQGSRLERLTKRVNSLEHIPYGGKMELAKELLEDEDVSEDRLKMLARLLALGETVIEDSAKLDVLTGKATLKSTPASAPTPEARRKPAAEQEEAQEQVTPQKEAPRKEARKKPAPKKAEKREAARATADTGGGSSRRRRRSRGASKRKSGASKRTSRGDKKTSRSSRSDSKRRSRSKGKSAKRRRSGKSKGSQRSNGGQKSTGGQKSNASQRSNGRQAQPDFSTKKMYMNVGRDHFDDEKGLLDMICFMSGFAPEDFGEVSVQSSYSFVHVREDYFYDIIRALNNQEWNDVSLTAEPARK
ncbi:MAG: DEAD/DEAH box helicase [Persicimonas sp.]